MLNAQHIKMRKVVCAGFKYL